MIDPVYEKTLEIKNELIHRLEAAYAVAYEATYQGHSAHWDKQGTHGANCPACIEARKARKRCNAILDGNNPVQAEQES